MVLGPRAFARKGAWPALCLSCSAPSPSTTATMMFCLGGSPSLLGRPQTASKAEENTCEIEPKPLGGAGRVGFTRQVSHSKDQWTKAQSAS